MERHGQAGARALFAAAAREGARALERLGAAAAADADQAGAAPPTAGAALLLAGDLALELVLLCEACGLAALATLFFAAYEEARAAASGAGEGSLAARERRAG